MIDDGSEIVLCDRVSCHWQPDDSELGRRMEMFLPSAVCDECKMLLNCQHRILSNTERIADSSVWFSQVKTRHLSAS